MSTTETSSSTTRADGARRVLDGELRAAARAGARSSSRARAVSSRATIGRPLGVGEHVAAADVDVVLEPDRHRLRRASPPRARPRTSRPRRRACGGPTAARRPRRRRARRRPRPGRRSRGSRGARRPSAGSPTAPGSGGRRGCGRRRARSSRGARAASARRTSGIASPRSTTLSPRSADIGIARSSCRPRRRRERLKVGLDLAEALLGEVDEVHLVHGDDDVRDREDRGDVGVAARLLDHALARVEQDHRDVRGRGAGDHVARVLHVPGRVGELEAAARRDERAVGDVDRDALLALGAQAVGEQREVDVAVAAPLARSPRCARAGRPGSASCRRAGGRSASTCRRRPSPR